MRFSGRWRSTLGAPDSGVVQRQEEFSRHGKEDMEQPKHLCLRERNQSERLHAGQPQLATPLIRIQPPHSGVTLWTGVNKCVGAASL